jgi:TP901 family phage tail tape measure protein
MPISGSRNARIAITADARGVETGVRDAKRQLNTLARDQEKRRNADESAMKRSESRGKSLMKGLAAGGIALAGLGISNLADDLLTYETGLMRLQIAGEMTNEQLATFRDRIKAVSSATGASRDDVLGVATAFVRQTGDMKGANEQLELMTKTMQATGASADSVAGVLSMFEKNLHLDPKDWQRGMDAIIKAGHMGGVEMADMAKAFTEPASEYAAKFAGGDTLKGMTEALAIFQKLNDLTHDPAVAGDRMKEALSALGGKDAKHLAGVLGINPFTIDPKTGKEVVKDGIELLHDIHDKLAKDPAHKQELMLKLFPDMRARDAISFLEENLDSVDDLSKSIANSNQLTTDYMKYQASDAAKIAAAKEQIKNTAEDALMKGYNAVQGVGKGAAMMIGGESEDDRITKLRAKRMDERIGYLNAKYAEANGPVDESDEDAVARRSKAVNEQLAREQMTEDNLKTMIAGGHINRGRYQRVEGPALKGQDGAYAYVNQGDYSAAELQQIGAAAGGTSDSGQIVALLRQLVDVMKAKGDANISIDGSKVAEASARAPWHRSRAARNGG